MKWFCDFLLIQDHILKTWILLSNHYKQKQKANQFQLWTVGVPIYLLIVEQLAVRCVFDLDHSHIVKLITYIVSSIHNRWLIVFILFVVHAWMSLLLLRIFLHLLTIKKKFVKTISWVKIFHLISIIVFRTNFKLYWFNKNDICLL